MDKLTNEVKTLGVWSLTRSAEAIDELIVHGQINGGILQSLGYGSMEKLEVKGGRFKQKSMSDYVIPTSMDFRSSSTTFRKIPIPGVPTALRAWASWCSTALLRPMWTRSSARSTRALHPFPSRRKRLGRL